MIDSFDTLVAGGFIEVICGLTGNQPADVCSAFRAHGVTCVVAP